MLQLKSHFKPEDVVVVLFHDSGSRYVGKMFNDDWMREQGYLKEMPEIALDLVRHKLDTPLVVVRTEELVSHALYRMKKHGVTELVVMDATGVVGSVSQYDLLRRYRISSDIEDVAIKELMTVSFPVIEPTASLVEVSDMLEQHLALLILCDGVKNYQLITKADLLTAI